MPWIELHITTSAHFANELSDQLVALGAEAVTFQDAGNQPIFEPTPETPRLWHQTIVIGLFDSEHPIEPVIQHLKASHLLTNYYIKHIADEDWERRCLDSFKPISFGKRLWICPSWCTPPEPSAVNVSLDPGLAFGTGTHPTTRLCLEWLDEHLSGEEFVIDYGCGSGILSIAALKLGAKQVLAIDNDPQALEATQINSLRNQIEPHRLTTQLPTAPISPSADLILANILAQPLIELAPLFSSLLKPKGKIVLSGILKEQTADVASVYNQLFILEKPTYQAEWTRLVGVTRIKLKNNN